jgi:YfiH family protein
LKGKISFIKQGDLTYLSADAFEQAGGIRHCFSTRQGGVSRGEFATLNLGPNRGDDLDCVRKNYEILCAAIGTDPENVVLSKQTHQDRIIEVTPAMRGNGLYIPNQFTDADGLITREKNVALVVFFADCVPVMLYDPKEKVIASIHSGWRGTILKIARKGVEKMVEDYGCRRENILACIGPSIGPCCYEVGQEVATAFLHVFPNEKGTIVMSKEGKHHLDLWRANESLLLDGGIRPEHITVAQECTGCHTDRYFSHRRMGDKRGTMISVVELI